VQEAIAKVVKPLKLDIAAQPEPELQAEED